KCLEFFPKVVRWLGRHDYFRINESHTFSIFLPTLIDNGMAYFMALFLFCPSHKYTISFCVQKIYFFSLWQFSVLLQFCDHFFIGLGLCFPNLSHNRTNRCMTNIHSCPLFYHTSRFPVSTFTAHFSHLYLYKTLSALKFLKPHPILIRIHGMS